MAIVTPARIGNVMRSKPTLAGLGSATSNFINWLVSLDPAKACFRYGIAFGFVFDNWESVLWLWKSETLSEIMISATLLAYKWFFVLQFLPFLYFMYYYGKSGFQSWGTRNPTHGDGLVSKADDVAQFLTGWGFEALFGYTWFWIQQHSFCMRSDECYKEGFFEFVAILVKQLPPEWHHLARQAHWLVYYVIFRFVSYTAVVIWNKGSNASVPAVTNPPPLPSPSIPRVRKIKMKIRPLKPGKTSISTNVTEASEIHVGEDSGSNTMIANGQRAETASDLKDFVSVPHPPNILPSDVEDDDSFHSALMENDGDGQSDESEICGSLNSTTPQRRYNMRSMSKSPATSRFMSAPLPTQSPVGVEPTSPNAYAKNGSKRLRPYRRLLPESSAQNSNEMNSINAVNQHRPYSLSAPTATISSPSNRRFPSATITMPPIEEEEISEIGSTDSPLPISHTSVKLPTENQGGAPAPKVTKHCAKCTPSRSVVENPCDCGSISTEGSESTESMPQRSRNPAESGRGKGKRKQPKSKK